FIFHSNLFDIEKEAPRDKKIIFFMKRHPN
ncbi:hypothetical protein LCGC14_2127380, partial [marine sediment metagenome]